MSEKHKEAFLGIDTSNYRTSVALYYSDGTYQSSRKLLPVPQGEKGLRQNDAVFAHVKQFSEVFGNLNLENTEIKGLGVSFAPRNTEGSYMPCFLYGVSVAETLAKSFGVKCFHFSHQQGHIAAGLISCQRTDIAENDFFALHASGGTTEVVKISGYDNIELVAGTRDISVGQLIDRAGVMLGFGFPCGEEIENSSQGFDGSFKIKVSLKENDCCLSGYENKISELIQKGASAQYVSAYVTEVCGLTLSNMLTELKSKNDIPVLCAGGVIANKRIRHLIQNSFSQKGFELPLFASPELSGDNAVGIAYLAYKKNMELSE